MRAYFESKLPLDQQISVREVCWGHVMAAKRLNMRKNFPKVQIPKIFLK